MSSPANHRQQQTVRFGCARLARQCGFTLIEAVIVITITAVIAAVVAVFIRAPVKGYMDSVARAELTDVADTTLRRIARDVRLALPNSVRISADGQYLELLLTKTGGRYLAEEDAPESGKVLKFDDADCALIPDDCRFDVVGAMPQGTQQIVAGDYIVVYNLGPGHAGTEPEPANAYNCTGAAPNRVCNRARVSNAPAGNTITLDGNPFANQVPAMRSPTRRFQVVTTPVTYFCNGTGTGGTGSLTRYWNYTIQDTQPVSPAALATGPAPQNALLATGVVNCAFSYNSLANIHSGLIGVTITLRSANNESVVLFHQVHVDNTP